MHRKTFIDQIHCSPSQWKKNVIFLTINNNDDHRKRFIKCKIYIEQRIEIFADIYNTYGCQLHICIYNVNVS